jgi:plasmid rolling circle replication initiator protein Rep
MIESQKNAENNDGSSPSARARDMCCDVESVRRIRHPSIHPRMYVCEITVYRPLLDEVCLALDLDLLDALDGTHCAA